MQQKPAESHGPNVQKPRDIFNMFFDDVEANQPETDEEFKDTARRRGLFATVFRNGFSLEGLGFKFIYNQVGEKVSACLKKLNAQGVWVVVSQFVSDMCRKIRELFARLFSCSKRAEPEPEEVPENHV